jgi:hypothetical protein
MSSYLYKKFSYNNAEQFKEAFYEPEPATVGYVFIGKNTPYANDASPDVITDSAYDEKSIWDNMIAAKRVTGNDVELVVPRIYWTANTRYMQFDDKLTVETLTTANVSNTVQDIYPMYILNSEGDVYLCLSNNITANSTVEPTGENLSANGIIQTADQYLWKYMYTIKPSNKFLTTYWMPVPISTNKLEYNSSSLTVVDGELTTVVVTNSGTGYVDSTITLQSFSTSCTTFTVANTNNLAVNMGITGTGFVGDTYITNIDNVNRLITLSQSAVSSGGGAGNTYNVFTRVLISGDGTGAQAEPTYSGNTISKINVTNYGKNYSFANVVIHGTGSNAAARVVLPPKYGHNYNAAKELGATNVMIAVRIGEIDSTENGIISANVTFRQYGLMRDPHKYGNTSPVTLQYANSVISQTTDVDLISGALFNSNEFVYQGSSSSNTTFSGTVIDQSANKVYLTNVKGTPSLGEVLKGTSTNISGRSVVDFKNAEFEPYSGDILYVENALSTQRTDGQSENIKFVVKF